jgi:hypothetical protein
VPWHAHAEPTTQVTHDGPLILTGDETFVIEDAIFTQRGNVEVRDQASLIIRDATIVFEQTYHEEFNWWFSGTSRLIIERSNIESPFIHTVGLGDDSVGQITDSSLDMAFLPTVGNASLTLNGSTINHLSLDPVNWVPSPGQVATVSSSGSTIHELSMSLTGTARGTIVGLAPGFIDSWTLSGIQSSQIAVTLMNATVENFNWAIGGDAAVTVQGCKFGQLSATERAALTVRDTTVTMATMTFDAGQRVVLRGLTSGQLIAHWDLVQADPDGTVPFRYVVENSQVDGWYIRSRGADLTLEDCDLHGSRLRPEFDDPTSVTRVTRSYVDELFLWWSYGRIIFDDATINHVSNPDESRVRMEGNVQFETEVHDTVWGPWDNSTITREYAVTALGSDGEAAVGAVLEVMDPSGQKIWDGRTDSGGEASFELAFTATNHLESWTLKMDVGGESSQLPVRVFSDSPLTLVIDENSGGGGGESSGGGGGCFVETLRFHGKL